MSVCNFYARFMRDRPGFYDLHVMCWMQLQRPLVRLEQLDEIMRLDVSLKDLPYEPL